MTVEFLGIEFAQDVEYPSRFGPTTQDSIIQGYLKGRKSLPYALVFNTGLHDLAIHADETAFVYYERTLARLTRLIQGHLQTSHLLYITTSGVNPARQPEDWRNLTSNARIRIINRAARLAMQKARIPVLDVFEFSQLPAVTDLSPDGTHVGTYLGYYYRRVAVSIMMWLCHDEAIYQNVKVPM